MKEHFGQTFNPASCSQCIFKNSDSRRHKVCRKMQFHAISCDLMQLHETAWDRMWFCYVICCSVVSKKNDKDAVWGPGRGAGRDFCHFSTTTNDITKLHAISGDPVQSHGIAQDRTRSLIIARDHMRSHEISFLCKPYVYNCQNFWKYTGNEKRDWSLLKVFLHDNWMDLLWLLKWAFLKKKKWEAWLNI